MKNLFWLVCSLFLLISVHTSAQKMDNKKLNKILIEQADSIKGTNGYWEILYKDLRLAIVTDEKHNRMRIISPIAKTGELQYSVLLEALQANFHSALDVKYAISDDIIWTVFIHPLKELSEGQITDALKQVYFGSKTFGGSYSSTDLVFPANGE